MSAGSLIVEVKHRKFRVLRFLLANFLFLGFGMPRLMNATNDLVILTGLVLAFFFGIWTVGEAWSLSKVFAPHVAGDKE